MVDRTMKKFCLDEIIYMETCGHATMIHTLHGDFRTNCSLTRAKEKMPDDGDFVTCGKSYYINAGYIKDVTKTEIILRGGEQIFIPIRLQKELCLLWQMKVNNNI
jgi:lytTr DNA-binding domain